MRAALALILLPSLFAGCVEPHVSCSREGPLPSWPPGDLLLSFCSDGLAREALIHSPTPLPPGPLPLLLMLHGGGGHAEQFRTTSAMHEQADERGFVVVFAQGTPSRRGADARTWNAMHCCGRAFEDDVDDVRFLGHVIERLAAAYPIDAGRIGVAGHSNGAMMAYRLAAERSDLVTHVAAIAGSIGGEPDPGDPVRRIPSGGRAAFVLILHARDDPRVPYAGGQGNNLDGPRVDLSVGDAVDHWRQTDGIGAAPFQEARDDGVEEARHLGGMNGTVIHVLTTSGGHGWPGSPDALFNQAPEAPDASEEIARFMVSHVRA